MIEIILESFGDLFKGFDAFLKTRDLTIGAILAGVAPFILIWIKISKEKEKRSRSQRVEKRQLEIENRQLRIESKIDDLMLDRGVVSSWNTQEIGSTHTVQKNSKPWLTIFMKATQQKKLLYPRRNKKMMQFLRSNISKKLLALIIGVAVTALNYKFNLQLSENDIYILFAGVIAYIAGQSHVDAKKAIASTVTAVSQVVQTSTGVTADTTYKDLYPTIKSVHEGINNLLADVQKNDGSQAFKDAASAYMSIMDIIKSIQQPNPLPEVPSQQESA